MGLYGVTCSECDKPFLWFSGNSDQRCNDCITKEAEKIAEDKKLADIADKFMEDNKELMEDLAEQEELEKVNSDGSLNILITSPKEVEVYVDGTDWQYEVGNASDGNTMYPGVSSLQKYSSCWKGCGVVKCKITFQEWVIPEDREEMYKDSTQEYTLEEFEKNREVIRFESAQKRLKWLEEKVAFEKNRIEELKNKIESEKK